ncbi:unnamed protein product, partial [Musa banksii]
PPPSPRRTAPPFLCFLLQETEVPPLHPLPLLLFFLTISSSPSLPAAAATLAAPPFPSLLLLLFFFSPPRRRHTHPLLCFLCRKQRYPNLFS